MNLVFGSEVALLGFWEYMFQILFRVHILTLLIRGILNNFVKIQTVHAPFSSVYSPFTSAFIANNQLPHRKCFKIIKWKRLYHRVYRAQDFLSSRPNWLSLPPHSQASVAPPSLWIQGGQEEEEGGANSDEGTDTLVLLVYSVYGLYFPLNH
jgi:hypothetical protein